MSREEHSGECKLAVPHRKGLGAGSAQAMLLARPPQSISLARTNHHIVA